MTGTASVATMPSGSDKSVSAGFLPRIRETQAPATAISANAQYGKLTGSSSRPVRQQAATSSPPVATGRYE